MNLVDREPLYDLFANENLCSVINLAPYAQNAELDQE